MGALEMDALDVTASRDETLAAKAPFPGRDMRPGRLPGCVDRVTVGW